MDAAAWKVWLDQFADRLEPKARREFGPIERLTLVMSMDKVGLKDYPEVTDPQTGERASGDMICSTCGHDYFSHPPDWRLIGYGDVPFLNILCDGRRVKL